MDDWERLPEMDVIFASASAARQTRSEAVASVARRACAFRTACYGRLSARVARWCYRRRLHKPLRVLCEPCAEAAQRLCRCEVLNSETHDLQLHSKSIFTLSIALKLCLH